MWASAPAGLLWHRLVCPAAGPWCSRAVAAACTGRAAAAVGTAAGGAGAAGAAAGAAWVASLCQQRTA